MTVSLAKKIAERLGGEAVNASAVYSGAEDVVYGSRHQLLTHRGLAKYGIYEPSPAVGETTPDGWSAWFEGEIPAPDGNRLRVRVVSRHEEPRSIASAAAPPSTVAIMAAYNEVDVISSVVDHLLKQGVVVYLIDNWSTDGTLEAAEDMFASGSLIGLERFPDEPVGRHIWDRMLRRKAEIAASLDIDWAVHNDADEIRYSPWPNLTLTEGIAVADHLGFNAIDFTVVEHPPVDESFAKGMDIEESFPYFRFGVRPGHFGQVKAWKPHGKVAEIGSGHDIKIPDRSIFPFNFLVRHYPIRSQAHGIRKVMRDRVPRWDPRLRAKGWHTQYDHVDHSTQFTSEPDQLERFDPLTFPEKRLGELIARLGLKPQR